MKELEELLPDFDDLQKLAIGASKAQLEVETLHSQIKDVEARCIRDCLESHEYWPGGRRPADTGNYLTRVVPRLGNNIEQELELRALRKRYAQAKSLTQEIRDLLELGRKQIDVFQTISANRRHTLAL